MNQSVRTWATAISTHAGNGRRIIWRFAQNFQSGFDRANQPYRIILAWKYESKDGQPMSVEYERMNQLEDALEPIVETGEFGTLALVSTGEGLREWTYFVRSEDDFLQRLNVALREQAKFPIEIHTARDETWSMYEEFKAGLKGSGTEHAQA